MGIITVICFALNEEQNISRFCKGYDFADHILIADGGSLDKTRKIASQWEQVEIIDTSHLQIPTPTDPYQSFRTPESDQVNILIKRAKELNSQWIIKDDADSWPNPRLKAKARQLFAETKQSAIFAYHLYIMGQNEYFPKLNKPGPGLWAWQPDIINIYADETVRTGTGLRGVPDTGHNIHLPLALLHYFAPDENTIQRKISRKAAKGVPMKHPSWWEYAPAEKLPRWATTL